MKDPALKSDRMQGIIFPHPTKHISYHRKMIETMNRLVGIRAHKQTKKPEYRHYLSNNQDELQDLLDQFKTRN
ncbi:MAG: hypothetical protein ABIQ89_04440 [Candidatus Saccharimonadales bacterium]